MLTGYAVDMSGALVVHPTARRGHVRHRERLSVHHPNAHGREGVLGAHQCVLDGERAYGRKHVAAVLGIGNLGSVGPHLKEEIVDIGVRAL